MTSPFAIVQARMGSRRLPGKMLADLGGKPLVYWAWNAARLAFGDEHTVVAIPETTENAQLAATVEAMGGRVWLWDGPEWDVLGRFHSCAHAHRWHPDSVIVRVTPDDPWKSVSAMALVARGERLPVELGAEAFTLAMLDAAHRRYRWPWQRRMREHISYALFDTPAPEVPPGLWTVDTQADLDMARGMIRKVNLDQYADIDISAFKGAQA